MKLIKITLTLFGTALVVAIGEAAYDREIEKARRRGYYHGMADAAEIVREELNT